MLEQQPQRSLHERAEHTVQPDTIPPQLRAYAQWVCWRYVDRGQGRKPDKQPVNPRTLANAGVHWANTWTTFAESYQIYLRHCNRTIHGIGFVLTPATPMSRWIWMPVCVRRA
jgi:primase-polymerase (primpol)-like protein